MKAVADLEKDGSGWWNAAGFIVFWPEGVDWWTRREALHPLVRGRFRRIMRTLLDVEAR